MRKTEEASTGRLDVVVSVSQGRTSLRLLEYRYVFDQATRLLAVTADYRKLAELDRGQLGGLDPKLLIFSILVDRRSSPTFYMSSPAFLTSSFQRSLPATARHRAWMKFSATAIQKFAESALGPAQGAVAALAHGPISPLIVLRALSTTSPSVHSGGEVDGAKTTRFATTADMTRSGALVAGLSDLAEAASARWNADAWVDRHLLIRQTQFTSPPIASQGNATIALTCHAQALDTPVDIKDPAASIVFDATALSP